MSGLGLKPVLRTLSRRMEVLTLRLLMSYIYIYIYDISSLKINNLTLILLT